MKRVSLAWILLPASALGVDWASKVWVLDRLQMEGSTLPVIPGFFNLTLGFNTGAIFGSLQSLPAAARAVLFGVAALLALLYFGKAFLDQETPRPERIALGLILGGAMGNALDRLQHGHVVDFLDFVIRGWHYWTFNLADAFIVSGAILYGLRLLMGPRTAHEPAARAHEK